MINKIKDTSSVIHELHDARIPETGIIPSSMLPSYVDDVIEGYYYDSKFYKDVDYVQEMIGAPGIIYVDLITNKTYRWSGSAYIEISQGDNVSVQALLSSGEQIGTIAVNGVKTDLYIPTPFSGSWNDLEDRPFGETTAVVGGDTLTWDGNTEGLVNVLDQQFKVSDVVPVLSDFANGLTIVISGDTYDLDSSVVQEIVPGVIAAGGAMVVSTDGVGVEILEGTNISYPEPGVYFNKVEGAEVTSLTIHGYTGFGGGTTIIPLDEKYIPDTIARVSDVDAKIADIDISKQIAEHNTDTLAHSDIRELVTELENAKTQVQIITWEADD